MNNTQTVKASDLVAGDVIFHHGWKVVESVMPRQTYAVDHVEAITGTDGLTMEVPVFDFNTPVESTSVVVTWTMDVSGYAVRGFDNAMTISNDTLVSVQV